MASRVSILYKIDSSKAAGSELRIWLSGADGIGEKGTGRFEQFGPLHRRMGTRSGPFAEPNLSITTSFSTDLPIWFILWSETGFPFRNR